jgi:hypothetical protein
VLPNKGEMPVPSQELLKWDKDFENQVSVVVEKFRATETLVSKTKEALLDFYGVYCEAYKRAKSLGSEALDYLHDEMGLNEKSRASLSEYRDIGEGAQMLRRHIKQLPEAQDALKLLAKVKESKLEQWVESGAVHPLMTIAATRTLTQRKKRAPASSVTPLYCVVLTSTSKGELATAVAALLKSTTSPVATCERPLHASVKGALGKHWWKANEEAARLIKAEKKIRF